MATLVLSGYDPVVLPPEGGEVVLNGTFPDDDSTYGTITPFSVYLYPPFAPSFLVRNDLTSSDKVTLTFTAPPLIPGNAGYHEIRGYSTAKGYIFSVLSPGIIYLDTGDDYVGSVSSPTVVQGTSFDLIGHFYDTGYTVVMETDGPTITIGPVDPSDASTLPAAVPGSAAPGFYTVKVYSGATLIHNVQMIEIVEIPIAIDELTDAVVTEAAPATLPSGAQDVGIVAWSADGPGAPWSKVGPGGTFSGARFVVTGGSPAGYRTFGTHADPGGDMEIQGRFRGLTSAPTWASGVSGHLLALDDGARALGVSIGDVVTVVDPSTGDVLWELPTNAQPGGWTTRRAYLLRKEGTTAWFLEVDGVVVLRLPYALAAASRFDVQAWSWGWLDPTPSSDGSGEWSDVEIGTEPLLPHPHMDRVRMSLDAFLQDAWNQRSEAMFRAILGTIHALRRRMERVPLDRTAGVLEVDAAELAGDILPAAAGWTVSGTAMALERARIVVDVAAAAAEAAYTFPTPTEAAEADAIYTVRAEVVVDEFEAPGADGRIGPFVAVRDGYAVIGAVLVASPSAPDEVAIGLSDGVGTAIAAGQIGPTLPIAGLGIPHRIELQVQRRNRVLLWCDGELVADLPYERFTGPVSDDNRVFDGRFGTETATGRARFSNLRVSQSYGDDTGSRALFVRQVAERQVFASGCEPNTRLDAWLRHRFEAFRARGTDRLGTEIARLACDDDTFRHAERIPAAWFLGVTYPSVTPTFLVDANTVIPRDTYEVTPDAPNFTWARLRRLIRRYLLPVDLVDARASVAWRTTLTTDPVTSSVESTFDVVDASELAAGDVATLRSDETGTLLTVEYTSTGGLAADTATVAVDPNGAVVGAWTADLGGEAGDIGGSIALPGLDAERLAAVTAAGRVYVRGATVDVDAVVVVLGKRSSAAAAERLRAIGIGTAAGAQAWDEVHGAVCWRAAGSTGAIDVVDLDTDTVLYTIADGADTAGAYRWDPLVLSAAAGLEVEADAATTAQLVVAGSLTGAAEVVRLPTLAGTTPVAVSGTAWTSVVALAAGYVPAARTVTLSGRLADGRASLELVSSSALDVQRAWVVVLLAGAVAELLEVQLNGTTPVAVVPSAPIFRVAGLVLSRAAIGTVTLAAGDVDAVTSIAPLGTVAGFTRRRIATAGPITVEATSDPAVSRWGVVVGRNEAGELAAEAVLVATDPQTTDTAWTEFYGMALGDVPGTLTLTASGTAWRAPTWEAAVRVVSDVQGWTCTGPGEDAFDGVLDAAAATSAAAGPVALTGAWSRTEDVTILDVAGETVTTSPIEGTFATGDTLRV